MVDVAGIRRLRLGAMVLLGVLASGCDASTAASPSPTQTDGGTQDDTQDGAASRADGAVRDAVADSSVPDVSAPASGYGEVAGLTNTAGLRMYVYIPSTLPANPRVVVLLHGCTQSATDARAWGFEPLADAKGLILIYPEQSPQNQSLRCFRWWEDGGRGEADGIRAMTEVARTRWGARAEMSVFGLSAGGAMAASLLGFHADRFRAGAVFAGVPFGCAQGAVDVQACTSGRDQTPGVWGARLRGALGANTPPRLQIWHGTADAVVSPDNARELSEQWRDAWGLGGAAPETNQVGDLTRETYGGAGRSVERITIAGLGHGVSVRPPTCGARGSYAFEAGVCTAQDVVSFFFGE
jgi:poly(hydroxyalkanoate) depolymerase family esterase